MAICCAIVFAYQNQAHAATGGKAPVFSTTQLADGVLFDNGPAAAYLTSLNRPVPPQNSRTTTIENATNAAISANPRLAASLQAEIQSGDPNQVQNALAQLGGLSVPVLDQLYGSQAVSQAAGTLISQINGHYLISAIGTGTELGNYAGDWVWADNAAVIYNVIFVASAAVVFVVFSLNPTGEAVNILALARQILVANIATNLQAAS